MSDARFAVGNAVRVRLGNPSGHCRVPAYLRGKRGKIIARAGSFVLADDRARGIEGKPQPVYTVAFKAEDIWGQDAQPNARVTAELWESYLEEAQ